MEWGAVRAYLDIGSGGGFPAFPIVLAAQSRGVPLAKSVLVERTAKRAAALGRMAASLDLDLEIVNTNFEDWRSGERFDLVTLRYIVLTPRLLRKVAGVLLPRGLFVYYSWPAFTIIDESLSVERLLFTLGGETPARRFTLVRRSA